MFVCTVSESDSLVFNSSTMCWVAGCQVLTKLFTSEKALFFYITFFFFCCCWWLWIFFSFFQFVFVSRPLPPTHPLSSLQKMSRKRREKWQFKPFQSKHWQPFIQSPLKCNQTRWLMTVCIDKGPRHKLPKALQGMLWCPPSGKQAILEIMWHITQAHKRFCKDIYC